ncbi:Probable sensor histidine kinase [Mycobacteroides abscessus subsp. abscessus]|nr:Probable sensor histidine kinase [Mycobacteroides abscessus subsp. abscessus]
MLADLAHELRTPVATIDAHLEAIEDGLRHLDADTIQVFRGSTQRLRRRDA